MLNYLDAVGCHTGTCVNLYIKIGLSRFVRMGVAWKDGRSSARADRQPSACPSQRAKITRGSLISTFHPSSAQNSHLFMFMLQNNNLKVPHLWS